MEPRRKLVVAALLVAAGAGVWFVVSPYLPHGRRAKQDAQLALDTVPMLQGVLYDLPLDEKAKPEFDAAWEKRRVLYDAEHLAEMRERLTAFVDFQVAEYADAKEIYVSGRVPERPSATALAAQARLNLSFGETADEMIKQFAERVREPAYQASPAVVKDVDPDLPNYEKIYHDVVERWLPQARAEIERLTAPSR